MTIAGSDPSGGAGLQADLKSFAACGVHGFAVITAVIAQNSKEVKYITPVDAAMATAAIVRCVAEAITARALPAPVVDPVFLSSSGARLLDAAGEAALRTQLIPLARVITPNRPEAEALTGIPISGPAALRAAARALRRMGARAVVIKGGHAFSAAADRVPIGTAAAPVPDPAGASRTAAAS